ncbi:MAG: 50S ribosomal protein L25/general stress protein Ctc [Alphaproteobacteria bacterium]|jgi:large subunit ribosomal protein L25|nr:50S ribosomal protein L25/general stress protein Ctc [Alphaproteobacteria bacterium]
MSDQTALVAHIREGVGKGAARAIRRQGKVPAVIYGEKQPPLSLVVDFNELKKRVNRAGFMKSTLEIDIDGKRHLVLPKAVQRDPIIDDPLHVDFLRIKSDTQIAIMVPVEFINHELSPGLKRGGTLGVVRHEVELLVPANAIPDKLVVDLAGLDIGVVIHISAVSLPENCTPTITDRDFTLATIAGRGGPSAAADEEETTEED